MTDPTKPFHNPFAVLGSLTGRPTDAPTPTETAAAAAPPIAAKHPAVPRVPRAVVRLERAGRGGKDVTVIEHLAIGAAARDAWLKSLKASLGCGGVVEGDALVLQGDHRKRLPALLTARGVARVTLG